MMKKVWLVLLAVVLVFGLVVSCGGSDDPAGGGEGGGTGGGTGGGAAADEFKIIELGEPTANNSDTQKGWCSNGTDSKTTTLEIEDLIAAKYLVLELSTAPTGGLGIVWQGTGNSWDWGQTDGILSDSGTSDADKGASLSDDNILTIELSKAFKDYDKFIVSTQVKFFICYYSPDFAGLGVTKAYLKVPK